MSAKKELEKLQAAYDAVVSEYAEFRRDRQEQMTRIRAALDDAYRGARTGNLITPHWVMKSIDDAREAGGWTLPPNREIRCPKCGGLNGAHGLVHTRHGNGGGSNSPCPNREIRPDEGGRNDIAAFINTIPDHLLPKLPWDIKSENGSE